MEASQTNYVSTNLTVSTALSKIEQGLDTKWCINNVHVEQQE